MSRYTIATIPGDGVGKEVVPAAITVLDAVTRRYSIQLDYDSFDWSCETYKATGKMMPDDGLEQLARYDSILLGAVGYPGVPDHISLWGLLIPIRRAFDQYVNLRPVRSLPGVRSPLRDASGIDLWVVRENTEGEYSKIGGRSNEGTPDERSSRSRCSRAKASTGSSTLPFALPASSTGHMSPRRPRATASITRCPTGTKGSAPSQMPIRTSRPTVSTSTSFARGSS